MTVQAQGNAGGQEGSQGNQQSQQQGDLNQQDQQNQSAQSQGGQDQQQDNSAQSLENQQQGQEKQQQETQNVGGLDESIVNQVEGLIKDAGLSPKEVAQIVTELDGEVSPAMMKALIDKHGEAIAGLIANNLKAFHTTNKEAAKKQDQAIFDQVAEAFKGITEQTGEQSWKELSGWAKENIADGDRKELNALLAQGGIAAKLAVQELVTAFKESNSYTQEAQLVSGDDVANTGATGALDKAGYDRELRELLNKGHDYNTSPEIARLNARRMKAIRRGQ